MLLKLTLLNNSPVLVNTDAITDIRVKETNKRTISAIYFVSETMPTEVIESIDEIYNQWLSTRGI